MTPTPKLRFVDRSLPIHPLYKTVDAHGNLVHITQTHRILQQWWEASPHTAVGTELFHGRGEWRDVPVEDEK